MNVKDFEIMAPVGSRESLAAAIKAGADSVYFGIGQLNMRSHSANHFTIDDLREIAETCNAKGIKTYLTVNTIIYDGDIPTMHQIIDAAHEAGISAVIACDIAVMQYCIERGVEVHLSTQLNISNVEALKFYAQFADVVVLARELNLDQVAEIHRQIIEQQIRGPRGELVRIEMFCHGALCMAVSGKCYMSLHDANRSANRGECIQICRRSYILTDAETGNEIEVDNKYLMSPKDLKTIRFIDKLMRAGVRVFKIEGRARGPEYVYTVVKCYKEAIEAVVGDAEKRPTPLPLPVREGSDYSPQSEGHTTPLPHREGQGGGSLFSEARKDEWDERLATVFNRGFWDGYYQGQRLGEWNKSYGSCATERKQLVGRVTKYFSRIGVAEVSVDASTFQVGDHLFISGPTTGALWVDVSEIHDNDGNPADVAQQHQLAAIRVPEKVRPNDKLFKIVKAES
jgi:putative protease